MENERSEREYQRVRAAQEQAIYASKLGAGIGGAMTPMAESYGDCAKAAQDPLRVRVERRLSRISDDAQDLMRIQALLNEHPEFEKFIELQNLLNRRGI